MANPVVGAWAIVAGDLGGLLFAASVIETGEDSQLVVTCLRMRDGSVAWQHSDLAKGAVHRCEDRGHAAPTPVVDSQRIYVMFETGQIVTLNHEGKVVWNQDVSAFVGRINSDKGVASSLAQDEANVFALIEHEGLSALVALNKRTGRLSWMAERPTGSSWSSPMLYDLHGVPQIVVNSKGSVTSYSAEDGRVLWSLEGLTGNVGPSAADGGQGRILVGSFASAHPKGWMQAMRSNLLVQVQSKDHTWGVEEPWLVRGAIASFASPFAHRGLGYWLDHHGRMTCVDLESGEVLYSEPTNETCRATPVCDGNAIFCFGESGQTIVLEAGREFRILARNSLSEPHDTLKTGLANGRLPVRPWSVAVVDRTIVLRSDNCVTCIR